MWRSRIQADKQRYNTTHWLKGGSMVQVEVASPPPQRVVVVPRLTVPHSTVAAAVVVAILSA